MIGTKVAHYEITSHLGSGGMGDVYQASDPELGRDVAIKFLPESFASDDERVARFDREARVLASLNHPNIATIYGMEQAASRKFLVMELVGGETLAGRISRGPLPIDEALRIAKQMCEALEAAHDKGIIHRDLKPANIKITPDEKVKVLDFGLAKAFSGDGSGTDLSNSPTMMNVSTPGVILGTAAYMSPEQARGKMIDRRTDLWAFGCLLYEMLTGKKLFAGETVSDTLAAVLTGQLDWNALPMDTPPAIRILLRRCLERDSQRRLPHIGAARIEIEDALSESIVPERTPTVASSRVAWILVAMMALGLTLLAAVHFREKAPEVPAEMRVDISTPATFAPEQFALSPDGKNIVFIASADGPPRLWLRRLDQATAQPLPGTENSQQPFWSPDSRSVIFSSSSQLKRLDISGGAPIVLAADLGGGGGGSWNSDGVILFVRGGELHRINASGEGQPVKVLQIPGAFIRWPQFLPDGKRFLFCVYSGAVELRGTYIGSLDEGTPRRLGPAENGAAWLPPDRVVFTQQGSLWARRLDLKRQEWASDAELITDSVGDRSSRRGAFSVSADGRIAYRKQSSVSQLTWLDREGKPSGRPLDPDSNSLVAPEISQDGTRVAVDRTVQGNRDVWLIDLVRGGTTKFTLDKAADGYPVWFPNGGQIAFETNRKGDFDIYVKPLNGGQEQPVVELAGQQWAQDISRDHKFLLYVSNVSNLRELWALPLTGHNEKPFVVATPAGYGQFSPDGRWVAFETNESGRVEVVVQPFPKPFGHWQVSTGGGWWPRWSRDGKELYFVVDGKLMAASIHTSDSSFEWETPKSLFQVQVPFQGAGSGGHPEYAVSRDGRFLVNQIIEETSITPVTLILNWKPKAP